MLRRRPVLIAVLLAFLFLPWASAQGRRGGGARGNARGNRGGEIPKGVDAHLDLQYAGNGNQRQRLDLYLPKKAAERPLPLIVWVHGGGWAIGNKSDPTALPLTAKGFAVASIEYRRSQQAIFPAQIEDCKAAVRWLRANAATYNLDSEHFGAWGSSAGGHLVALLGTSGDAADLEGQAGDLRQSSRVQAVVDWFGPTDLLKMGGNHDQADSFESQLIGGPLQQNKEKANRANPIAYITPNTPPFLIMHGTRDTAVPINQSELLAAALKKAGVEVTMIAVKGARHGDPAFSSNENMQRVEKFFRRHLIP